MGDQLAKPSDFDLGWLAGFIDGEGSLNLHRQNHAKGYTGWRPWFTVGNTHPASLERLTTLFDQMGIAYYVSWDRHVKLRRDGIARKPLWRVDVAGLKRMQRLLVVLISLLYTKKHQAELFLEFVNLRLSNPGWKRGMSEAETALVPQLLSANRSDASTTAR